MEQAQSTELCNGELGIVGLDPNQALSEKANSSYRDISMFKSKIETKMTNLLTQTSQNNASTITLYLFCAVNLQSSSVTSAFPSLSVIWSVSPSGYRQDVLYGAGALARYRQKSGRNDDPVPSYGHS